MADHKPSIVFVPGSFALPEFYDNITTAVAAKGYEIKAIRLPSVGAKSASSHTPDSEQDAQPHSQTTPTMFDDAAFITHEVTQLADQGKDVILIAHSYGGIPTSESIKGLAKAERTVGGVVRVAYITALVPKLGASAMDVLADVAPENRDELQIDEHGWMYHSNHIASAALSFSDLPSAEGEAWLKRFPRHSAASFATPLTYAGYKYVDVSYLVCENDKIIPVHIQREEIEMIENESGREVDVAVIQTGHVPMASAPQKVVEWILSVAQKHHV